MDWISAIGARPAFAGRYATATVLILSGLATLSACGGAPKKPDPISLKVTITASADINPDVSGRPSPLVLALYQLAAIEAFENADFFSVFDESGAALGDTLLKREQLVLKPGESREYEAELNPDTAYVGVVAAFRDIENATWRSFLEVPKESIGDKINIFSKNRLNILADALEVSLSE